MQLSSLHFETKLQKCIRMGVTSYPYSKFSFGQEYIRSELRFTALLVSRHKLNF